MMMKNIKSQFFLILLAIIFSAATCLSAETPAEIVVEFCKLDYEGNRLSSDTYQKLQPLISYPEEPGGDMVIGVDGFSVLEEHIKGKNATVLVRYDINPEWLAESYSLDIEPFQTFNLVFVEGKWKIKEYILYPRASVKVLCHNYGICKPLAHH